MNCVTPETRLENAAEIMVDLPAIQRGLETALMQLLGAVCPKDRVRVVAKCWGWDGGGRRTYKEAGQEYGVTRQAVYEAAAKAARRLKDCGAAPPLVVGALEYVGARAPELASRIECALVLDRLAEKAFRLEGLVKAAEVFGLQAPFKLVDFYGVRYVLPPRRSIEDLKGIRHVALTMTVRRGWGIVGDVAGTVKKKLPEFGDPAKIAPVLACCPELEWLGKAGGMFWMNRGRLNETKNALVKSAVRSLAVCGPLSLQSLREGLLRTRACQERKVPDFVLREILERAGLFRIEGSTVDLKEPRDWKSIAAPWEAKIVSILKEMGDLPYPEFQRIAISRGVPPGTFSAGMTVLPYIERRPSGLYGLRRLQEA